MQYINLRTRNS